MSLSVAAPRPSIAQKHVQEPAKMDPAQTDSNGLPSLPALDLDEAAQSISALSSKVGMISRGDLSSLYEELLQTELWLKNTPMEYIASLISPGETLRECSVAMGIDVFILFLSLLAINGGKEGQGDAGERKVELSSKRAFLESVAKDTAQSFERKDLEKFEKIQKHELGLLKASEEMNAYDEAIGKASLRAGKAIRDKTLVELCAHIVLTAMTSTLLIGVGSGISLSFAISASVLSLALGIWAAMSAVRLGRAFHAKTKARREWAQAERKAIDAYVQKVEQGIVAAREAGNVKKTEAEFRLRLAETGADADRARRALDKISVVVEQSEEKAKMVAAYLESIQEEALHREEFANSFYRWNLGFLTSTSLYGSSAIFQNTLVTLPALAGFTALANPVVLGVLLASGMFGSIAMAICSQQFLYMPDEQKRYDKQLDQYLPQTSPNPKAPLNLVAELDTVLNKQNMEWVQMEPLATAMPSPAQSPVLTHKQLLMPLPAQPPMLDLPFDSVDRSLIIAANLHLGPQEGALLQAATHKRIEEQENARHTFLEDVAVGMNKNYNAKLFRWQPVRKKREDAPDFSHSCKAALSVMGVLARVFANPVRMAELLRQARKEWKQQRNTLTVETLKAFLADTAKSRETQSEFMKRVFKSEQNYLDIKNETYEKIKSRTPGLYRLFKDQHEQVLAFKVRIDALIDSSDFSEMREGFIEMQKPKDEARESQSFQKGKMTVNQAIAQELTEHFWESNEAYKNGHGPRFTYENRRGVNFVLAGSLAQTGWA